MATAITQSQINTSKQNIRKVFVKLNILNYNFRVVDSIQGNILSGEVQVNANNDIRRTCNLSLLPIDSSFDIKKGSKIWLDTYIKVNGSTAKNFMKSKYFWYLFSPVNNTLPLTSSGLAVLFVRMNLLSICSYLDENLAPRFSGSQSQCSTSIREYIRPFPFSI